MTTLKFELQVLYRTLYSNYAYHIAKKREIFGFGFFRKQEGILDMVNTNRKIDIKKHCDFKRFNTVEAIYGSIILLM